MSTIQCPRCGSERPSPHNIVTRDEMITKGVNPEIVRKGFFSANPNAANEWIDVRCTKCGSTFQYNTRTQSVRS